jgi:hypothetical protein
MRIISKSQSGSALLIVLAFVVLIAGLVLVFFSRSILEEQVSSSSANQVKVDNFALGAISATVSDLKQEIMEGSTVSYPVAGNNYVYYYAPAASGGAYPTMVPAVTPNVTSLYGSSPSLGQSGSAYANLIKLSVYGAKFYKAATPYNTSQTDPNRASPVSTGASSDANGTISASSTDGTSLNGRYISAARWMKPQFLPSGTNFPFPDWIYVQRTPAVSAISTWDSTLNTSPNDMTVSTTVVGRYAYAIYDEGGLLDINVAGVPSPITAVPNSVVSAPDPHYQAYKDALAGADLTQIGLTQPQIDKIVGWRNYASVSQSQNAATTTALSGNVTSGYTWTGSSGFTSATNYWANVVSNPTGFLRPMNAWATTPTSLTQSDQFFTSRQQLIQFFNQTLGGGTTVMSALQYLTHFSRSINQPSYVPPPLLPTSGGKPATAVISSGGNDLATSTSGAADAAVNPNILSARVGSISFTRNDGSIANAGDPLVKKRFALNRLAWLTYLGPIADDNGNYNTATGISTMVTLLKSYGLTDAFLRQGGPANIYKFFGLTWQSDTRSSIGDSQSKWYYNHESLTAPTAISATAAHIRTLSTGSSTVASLYRDPDFFELMKATVCLGSLGKAYSTTTNSISNFHSTDPNGYQAALDNSTDGSIIQMGANIIDQFQPAGFAARILFYDGTFSYPLEFRGVEDMPYLYRVREGKIMTQDSSPIQSTLPTTSSTAITTFNTPSASAGAGSGVLLLEPEIWNPHAWNSANNPDTNPRPTSFRIVAISTSPGNASSAATNIQLGVTWRWATNTSNSTLSLSASQALNESNSAMTFSIPTKAQNATNNLELFREPTLLIKKGYPTGSSLNAANANANVTSIFPAAQYPSGVETAQSLVDKYIGIYVGTLPMAWSGTIPAKGLDNTLPASATTGLIPAGAPYYASGPTGITYRMQYETSPGSGTWVTYDEKYAPIFTANSYNYPGSFSGFYNHTFYEESAASPVSDFVIGSEYSVLAFDPRSSRFGMTFAGPNGRGLSGQTFPLGADVGLADTTPAPLFLKGWASPIGTAASASAATQSAILTTRPDENRGMLFSSYDGVSLDFGNNCGPTGGTTPQGNGTLLAAYGGWYPIPTVASTTGTAYGSSAQLLPGLFVQNNPAVASAQYTSRFAGDTAIPTTLFNQFLADADGVVRRGMAAYVPVGSGSTAGSGGAPAIAPSGTGVPSGIPTKEMMDYTQTPAAQNSTTNEYQSRPILLNRPFRSVADLDYVFSGIPWRNVDMSIPESGAAGLLDVFCINDTEDVNGLVDGKVSLNTRQPLVIQAILNGAYMDEFNPGTSLLPSAYATAMSTALTNRTQGTAAGLGPLRSVSDLVGRWKASVTTNTSPSVNGSSSFVGFTSDTVNSINTTTAMYDMSQALILAGSGSGAAADAKTRVERFRNASIRALANCGQTRVWNLMIDVIAQTGRLPATATSLNNFSVEGEQRYWVHIAIDRYTGQVLDQQVEQVKE